MYTLEVTRRQEAKVEAGADTNNDRRTFVRGLLALSLSLAGLAQWLKPAAGVVIRDGWILSKAD